MVHCMRIVCLVLSAFLVDGLLYADEAALKLPTIRPLWLDTKESPSAIGTGSWSIIPYAQFNKTWQKAKQVADTSRLPWLTEATYSATLDGVRLKGKAALHLHNPHALSAWGRLRPWSMPLTEPTRETDGLIRADESGKGLLVLTPPATTQPVTFHWEAVGEERQGGKWFSLQLPACPQATMSLMLPAPLRVEWPAARQHVSGPHPVPDSNLQRWDLRLGGQARQEVQFVIRNRRDASFDLSLDTKIDADYVVGIGEVQARYELDVQRWHDRLRSLTLEFSHPTPLTTVQLKQMDSTTQLTWQAVSPSSIRIALPETIEQRASLLVEASWKTTPGERIVFPVLSTRGGNLVRYTMRVAWEPTQQLADWNWGDFIPQPVTTGPRFQTSADWLTLSPYVVAGTKPLQAPSARLIPRAPERSLTQDQCLQIGKTSQLLVQSQLQMKARVMETLSWQVPTGWHVTEVQCEPSASLLAWTALPDKPLEVQVEGADSKVTLLMTLVPEQPLTITEEPRTLFMPMLKPLSPGRWNGLYGIMLERTLQPAQVTIVQQPGTPVTLPADAAGIWAKWTGVPDWCWQLTDAQATGTLQWQQWPAIQHARVRTELINSTQGMSIRFQVKLLPVAGRMLSWPVEFSAPVGDLKWTSSTGSASGWTWKQLSSTQGEFRWEQPVEKAEEFSATLPWEDTHQLPLLSSAKEFKGILQLDAGWEPRLVAGQLVQLPGKAGINLWGYDAKTSLGGLQRVTLHHLTLIEPRLLTHLEGNIAASEYTVQVPAHAEPLTMTFPRLAAVQVRVFELDGIAQPIADVLTVPACNADQQLRLTYRSAITSNTFWSSWTTVAPIWSVSTSPELKREVTLAPSLTLLGGYQTAQRGEGVQRLSMTAEATQLWWMPRQTLYALAGFVFLAGCWLCRKQHGIGTLLMLSATTLLAIFLPATCWLLGVAGGLSIFLMWSRTLGTAFLKGFLLVMLTCSTLSAGQGQPDTVLVYLLPGESNKLEDARVMVPAALWKQMQKLSDLNAIGAVPSWWATQVQTEGELVGERLRLTSRWHVEVTGNEPTNIPWLPATAPWQILLDDVPIQPGFLRGPFGIQQFSIPIARPGRHLLTMKWEMPIQRSAGWQSATISLPGSPWQALLLKGLPGTTVLKGAATILDLADEKQSQQAQVGLVREVSLFWPVTSEQLDEPSSVEAGVLWEHRLLQSTAHVVLTYHLNRPYEALTVVLPPRTKVKNLNLVGDVQALHSPHIRNWKVQTVGEQHHLVVQLQQPVSGTLHLLLELPWQRGDTPGIVPLDGVQPLGFERRSGFVAYMADGLQAQPMGKLAPIDIAETAFARPWLPSLASLPESAFTKLPSDTNAAIALKLEPLSLLPEVRSQLQVVLDAQDVQYRYQVDVARSPLPRAFLKAEVASGLTISDVTGPQVASWQQTQSKPGEPSQLMIWLTASPIESAVSCTILARRPLEQPDSNTLRVPLYRIQWEGHASAFTLVSVVQQRPDSVTLQSVPAELLPLTGPWPNSNQLGVWKLPARMPAGLALLFHQKNQQQHPRLQSTLERQGSETYWKLTLTAPAPALLPTEIEMVVPHGGLEQLWQFETSLPSIARPSRVAEGSLRWTIRMNQPVPSLTVKCLLKHDATGKPIVPSVSFPNWPGLSLNAN